MKRSATKEISFFGEDDTYITVSVIADFDVQIKFIPDTNIGTEEIELPDLSIEDAKKLRDFLIYALAQH